jgi:NADH dehydrogenase FAD-containing subunit
MAARRRVLILGGGFGGLVAAQKTRRGSRKSVVRPTQ